MLDFLARLRRPRGSRRNAERTSRGGSKGRTAQWALWVMWALVPLSALALGAIPVAFTVVAAFLAAGAAVLAALGGTSRRGAPLLPFLLLMALAVYTVFQSLPLPLGLLEKVDPAAGDVWARSLAPIGGHVTWGSLSLNPGNTSVEAAKWASYACVFYASSSLARSHGMRTCLQIVVASSVALALVTVAHQLLEANRVFGIYQPHAAFTGRIGPLLNSNHLAGYLNLGALCAVGLALSPRDESPRWLFATAAIIDVAASLRTASRGGAAALLVGLLLLGVLIVIPSGRSQDEADRTKRFTGLTMILATTATGVALAALGFDRALWSELTSVDAGKMRMAAWFKPMAVDFASFGIGRGAFESAFQAYRPQASGNTVFTHPENFIAQWVCEWGIVGLLGLAAFVWLFRPWRLGLLRSVKSAAALCAIVAILIQNLADFSLEVPGVALAFSTVLGALWGNVRGRQTPGTTGRFRLLPVFAAATLAGATGMVALSRGLPTLTSARDDVHQSVSAANKGKLPAATAKELIVQNMRRFPAEYYFPLAGADLAFHAGGDPIPWLQRALERGPTIGLTHFILAEYLASRGARSQAFMELRLTAEYEGFLADPVAMTALSWSGDFRELTVAVPEGLAGVPVLEAMAGRVKDVELAGQIAQEMLIRDPKLRNPRIRILEALLAALAKDECVDRIECEQSLDASSEALRDYFPESSIGDQYLARFAILDLDPKRALWILRRGCLKLQDVSECLRLQATVEDPEHVSQVLDRFLGANCGANAPCAQAYIWVAGFQAARSSFAKAYGSAEKAARMAPSEANWLYAASLAEQAGLREDAARALEQVARYQGANVKLKQRIESNRTPQH